MKRKIVAVLTACISLLVCLFGMAMPVGAEEETTYYRLEFVNKTEKSSYNDKMPTTVLDVDEISYNISRVPAGKKVILPNVDPTENSKLGYWSLREDGKFKRYEPGETYTVKSNTTFYFVTPTIDLTIAAETENHVAQSFIYEITATDFSMVVCVDAGESLTIDDLPAVDYTVTELTAHSWRYTTATSQVGDTTSGKAITVGLENAVDGVVEVTFNHSDREDKWLTGADSKTFEYTPMFTVSHAITLHHQDNWYNLEVYNNGNIDIYVRMAITTHYVDGEGNISGAKGSWDSKLKDQALGDGWVEYGGFYYYTKPLTKWEVSKKLFANYTFPSADARWMYSAQSVEAHPDALRNTWGVVISEGSVTAAF